MLTFLLTAAFGAYLAHRIGFAHNGVNAALTVDYLQIWQDLIGVFTLIAALYQYTVQLTHTISEFANAVALPWLNAHGVSIALPTVTEARALVEHQ